MTISTFIPATEYTPPTYLGSDMTGEIVGGWEVFGVAGKFHRPDGRSYNQRWKVSCIYCGLYTARYPHAIRKSIHGCQLCSERYHSGPKHKNWAGSASGIISGDFIDHFRQGAKGRARPIEFSIDAEFLGSLWAKQSGKCAYSGVPLSIGMPGPHITASLDRIDSSLGYTEDNVQFVHKAINQMKWDLSHDDFLMWVNLISKNNGGKNE